MLRIIISLLIYGCAGIVLAKDSESIIDHCLNLTTKDKSYFAAAQRVMNFKSVKEWSKNLDLKNKRVAIGSNVDKTVFKNERCFWSISLYESDESKLQMWREYLIEIDGEIVFILNPQKN